MLFNQDNKRTHHLMSCLFKQSCVVLITALLLTACMKKGSDPRDPFETYNRAMFRFNSAFDATVLKPPAVAYKTWIPAPVRGSIDNAYDNIHLLPTVANDLLQQQWQQSLKDSWRFLINSTLGIGGLFDVAVTMGLPPHSNDLGLTFAKWGDKTSPYFVLPIYGPSTIRDGVASIFDFTLFTPYPYINDDAVAYSIVGLRLIDLRSQLFDTDRLTAEALDPYAFIRDAYLQNRHYRINGTTLASNPGALYVDEEEVGDYIDDEVNTDTTAKKS